MLRLDAAEEKKPPASAFDLPKSGDSRTPTGWARLTLLKTFLCHGGEVERVAAGGCLIEARRTAAAAQSAGAESTTGAATAGPPPRGAATAGTAGATLTAGAGCAVPPVTLGRCR